MNERIREIANRAGMAYLHDYSEDGHAVVCNLSDVERFAELIVNECMNVVVNGKYSAGECERNTHRIAHNNARDEASSDIKKHFRIDR